MVTSAKEAEAGSVVPDPTTATSSQVSVSTVVKKPLHQYVNTSLSLIRYKQQVKDTYANSFNSIISWAPPLGPRRVYDALAFDGEVKIFRYMNMSNRLKSKIKAIEVESKSKTAPASPSDEKSHAGFFALKFYP